MVFSIGMFEDSVGDTILRMSAHPMMYNHIQEIIMVELVLLDYTAVLVQDKQVCSYLYTSVVVNKILFCAIQKVLNLTGSYLRWDYVWRMINHSKKM